MPTLKEWQTTEALKTQARRSGFAVELSYTPTPKAQWYRGDGVPLPNKLPSDPYHRNIYEAKGWTLFPPKGVQTITPWKPGEVAILTQPDSDGDAVTASTHQHRFKKAVGSSCSVQGCSAVRTRLFASRKGKA
jgi:hypothetical protein